MRYRLEAAGRTRAGLDRAHNEDAFIVDLEIGLFVVADGISGDPSGEVASKLAVDTVRAFFRDADVTWPPGMALDARGDASLLSEAVQRAGRRIVLMGQHPPTRGMGTTIAAVLTRGSRAVVAHVGDSRVYRLLRGRMERLTDDHTVVAELVRRGVMEPQPRPREPAVLDSVLTRSLGKGELVDVDVRAVEMMTGDVLLLCSDGLWDLVPEEEVAAILSGGGDLTGVAEALIARVEALEGSDDATAVLVRWGERLG